MKIILLADVKKVGARGAVADVADGYANNVLIPKKLALPATPQNLKRALDEKEGKKERALFDAALAKKTFADINGAGVRLAAKANERGGLFEAIRSKQVAEAIRTEFGIVLPEEAITLVPEAIKNLGEFRAELTLHGASAEIGVTVAQSSH